jgi:hypothetical protein
MRNLGGDRVVPVVRANPEVTDASEAIGGHATGNGPAGPRVGTIASGRCVGSVVG